MKGTIDLNALKTKLRGFLGGTFMLWLLSPLRGHLPARLWRSWPVCGSFDIDLPGSGSIRIAGADNDWFDRVLYWLGFGGDEPETYPIFMGLARGSGLVLDIGANEGIYTLLACAADPEVNAMAFEPVPQVFAKLQANVEANGWTDRCALVRQAASDRKGTATFHMAPSGGSIHAGFYPDRVITSSSDKGSLIEVEVVTVDEACAAEKGRVGLVKIDVEGYEDQVLLGMTRILSQDGPDLVVECMPEGPIVEIEEIVKKHGYNIYHIREGGPVPMGRISPDPERNERNFLFSRDPDVLKRLGHTPQVRSVG